MIKINPDVVHRLIDGRVYIADPSRSMLYELNETAGFVWRFLTKKKYASDTSLIVDELLKEYEVDEVVARKDVDKLIRYLLRKKLIRAY